MMEQKRDKIVVVDAYRKPGSRFDRMMSMVESGACEEAFQDEFGSGSESSVYRVVRGIVEGTISTGDRENPYGISRNIDPAVAIDKALLLRERQDKVFRMLDDGMRPKDIQIEMGLSRGGMDRLRAKWAVARGLARGRRQRGV